MRAHSGQCSAMRENGMAPLAAPSAARLSHEVKPEREKQIPQETT